MGDIATRLCALLEAFDVRLRHSLVRFDGEEQGRVDIDAFADQLTHRWDAGGGGRHLDHDILAVDELAQPAHLIDGCLRVVGDIRRDLHTHIAIEAVAALVDRAQRIRRHLDVFDRNALVDLVGSQRSLAYQGFDHRVVIGAPGDGLFENGRIRGHAQQALVLHHLLQLAGSDEPATYIVVPDTLAEFLDRNNRIVHKPSVWGWCYDHAGSAGGLSWPPDAPRLPADHSTGAGSAEAHAGEPAAEKRHL